MKISIIVPVYNAEDYLKHCVDSVLKQHFKDFELIFVDDGSADGSLEACRSYAAVDERVHVIHKNNGGVSSARNAGMSQASGEYILFLDSDDKLEDNALDILYSISDEADFVYGGYSAYQDDELSYSVASADAGLYIDEDISAFIDTCHRRSRHSFSSCWGKLYRREVIERTGMRFNEELCYAEDKLFVYRFLLECRRITATDRSIYRYCLRSSSLGSDKSSGSHLRQLELFLPLYRNLLQAVSRRFPDSDIMPGHYHKDLVGGYVCRALNVIASRKSPYQNAEFIRFLYDFMDGDEALGIFSIRAGQIPNILLYKAGSPGFTAAVYRLTSSLFSCIR